MFWSCTTEVVLRLQLPAKGGGMQMVAATACGSPVGLAGSQGPLAWPLC